MNEVEFLKERTEEMKLVLQKENRKETQTKLRGDISECNDRISVLEENICKLNRMMR